MDWGERLRKGRGRWGYGLEGGKGDEEDIWWKDGGKGREVGKDVEGGGKMLSSFS